MKKEKDIKKLLVIGGCIGIVLFVVLNRIAYAWENSPEQELLEKFNDIGNRIQEIIIQGKISFTKKPVLVGLIGIFGTALGVLYIYADTNNYRPGEEHGSAKWARKNDILPFMNTKDPFDNILLSQTEKLGLDDEVTKRNRNIKVIGGSGCGKTYRWVLPNILQMNTSYVVVDPKGTLLYKVGKMLKDNGYEIKIFNTINFERSQHFNPFAYMDSVKSIDSFITTLIMNTSGEGIKSGEDFWVKAEKLLYQCLIGYMIEELPMEERTFETLLLLLEANETKSNDDEYVNAIDVIFKELEEKKGRTYAVKKYKKYKLAAGDTAKSIMISCAARLGVFDGIELNEITAYDEMELDTIGDRKTALFLILDDGDPTYNFMVAIMYQTLFKELYYKADNVYGGRLPVPVQFYQDEFYSSGQPALYKQRISTCRSRNIGFAPMLQNEAQLKELYDKSASVITDNCDTIIFLGSGGEDTTEFISKMIGDETIHEKDSSETRGSTGSWSQSDRAIQRRLMTSDEVRIMDNEDCIIFLRGKRPFKSKKIDPKTHPNYKLTAYADPANIFDVEREIEELRKPRMPENGFVMNLGDITQQILDTLDIDQLVQVAEM